jgi:hypothetical protein
MPMLDYKRRQLLSKSYEIHRKDKLPSDSGYSLIERISRQFEFSTNYQHITVCLFLSRKQPQPLQSVVLMTPARENLESKTLILPIVPSGLAAMRQDKLRP